MEHIGDPTLQVAAALPTPLSCLAPCVSQTLQWSRGSLGGRSSACNGGWNLGATPLPQEHMADGSSPCPRCPSPSFLSSWACSLPKVMRLTYDLRNVTTGDMCNFCTIFSGSCSSWTHSLFLPVVITLDVLMTTFHQAEDQCPCRTEEQPQGKSMPPG